MDRRTPFFFFHQKGLIGWGVSSYGVCDGVEKGKGKETLLFLGNAFFVVILATLMVAILFMMLLSPIMM